MNRDRELWLTRALLALFVGTTLIFASITGRGYEELRSVCNEIRPTMHLSVTWLPQCQEYA